MIECFIVDSDTHTSRFTSPILIIVMFGRDGSILGWILIEQLEADFISRGQVFFLNEDSVKKNIINATWPIFYGITDWWSSNKLGGEVESILNLWGNLQIFFRHVTLNLT